MNRGRRQVTLTRESRGETACCSLGPAMAIYTTTRYNFDCLFVVKSNHNHRLLKSLDSLVLRCSQRPPSIMVCTIFFVLAGADDVSTAFPLPVSVQWCRPKIGLSNRLGNPPSSLQKFNRCTLKSQLSELLIS
jgi:hypothetical protein